MTTALPSGGQGDGGVMAGSGPGTAASGAADSGDDDFFVRPDDEFPEADRGVLEFHRLYGKAWLRHAADAMERFVRNRRNPTHPRWGESVDPESTSAESHIWEDVEPNPGLPNLCELYRIPPMDCVFLRDCDDVDDPSDDPNGPSDVTDQEGSR